MERVSREDLLACGDGEGDGDGAAAVVAMGSLQYTPEPVAMVAEMATWLRPGGVLAVLVDSRVGLALELIGADRGDEALLRLATARGVWRAEGQEADLHLLDAATLTAALAEAGLVEVRAAGLLVSAGPLGRSELIRRAEADYETMLALERRLADFPELADAGKQLLVTGRRPTR